MKSSPLESPHSAEAYHIVNYLNQISKEKKLYTNILLIFHVVLADSCLLFKAHIPYISDLFNTCNTCEYLHKCPKFIWVHHLKRHYLYVIILDNLFYSNYFYVCWNDDFN